MNFEQCPVCGHSKTEGMDCVACLRPTTIPAVPDLAGGIPMHVAGARSTGRLRGSDALAILMKRRPDDRDED